MFDEMCSKISCEFIIERYAKQTVFVNGVEFVITGGVGSGNGGWSKMWGYRVVDFHKYTGDLPVMNYSQHIRSEEHTSELQSLMRISYAVFCLKKKKK